MFRASRAFCLWTSLIGFIFGVVYQVLLAILFVVAPIVPDGIRLYAQKLVVLLLLLPTVVLALDRRVIKPRLRPIPTSKLYASTDWADSE